MNPNRPIREIMTTNLVTVGPDTPIRDIKHIFDRNGFHHLPVVERGDKLVGIISKTDFFQLSYLLSLRTTGPTWTEKSYQALVARDVMTQYPVSLDPEDTIGLAADIFLANKFHALPIIEDEQLVGLITTHDLLLYSYNSPIPEVESEGDYY